MGRKRSFLGFFVSLFVLVFSANAFAEGYVCDLEYDECNAGYYLNDSSQCVPCPTGTGWASTTQAHNTASACNCPEGYWNSTTHESTVKSGETCVVSAVTVTINKNGGTGTLEAITVSGDAPTVATNSGTSDVTITCTPGAVFRLRGISRVGYTLDGFSENQNATSGTEAIQCPSSTTTFYAIWDDCEAGHYCDEDGDHTCPAGYTSDKNSDDIRDCYRACTTDDIPHATSYTSDSRFYYNDTAPSQCKAAGCEDGYTPSLDGTCVANTFTVTYDGNGNTGGTNPGSHTCTYGDTSCKAKANTFTKTNYDFVGWAAACDPMLPILCSVNDNDVDVGDDISTITNDNGVTIVLKAKWAQKSGSGDCSCTAGAGAENCTASINSQDATKCDYSWSCKNKYWNSEQIATGQGTEFTATCDACPPDYNDGSVSPRNARTTCYAKRTPTCTKNEATMPNGCTASYSDCQCDGTKYTVYSNSAGTGDGTIDGNTTEECTKDINLSTLVAQTNHYVDDADGISCPLCSTLEPEDYYAYSAGGSDGYSQCYHICTIDDVEHARAVEEENVYYDAEDATCHATECEGDYYLENGVCVDCPDNAICDGGEGFDCKDGYHKNTAGNGCDPNNYTVNYNSNGGTGTMSPSQRTYNDDGKLRKNTFENGTSTFQGWMKTSSGDVAYPDEYQGNITGTDNKPIANNGSITLYAKWGACPSCTDTTTINCTVSVDANNNCAYSTSCKPGYGNEQNHNKVNASCSEITYNITYDLNQGDSSATPQHGSNHPATYTVTTATFTISNPSMAGYVFDGWTVTTAPDHWGTGSSSSGATNFKIGKGTYGNIKLTAIWSDCPAGSYCDPDGNKFTCTEKINDGHTWTSDKNSDDIHDCYRACAAGDIPNATSYTSDSRFYYDDEAPSQCKAAGCESGYDGDNCDPADGTKYYVCHYIKEVGKSTYMFCPKGSLSDGCTSDSIVEQLVLPDAGPDRIQWLMTNCEQKTGVTGANTPAFTTLAKSMPGFTYTKGCANETGNTITGVTNAACSSATSTTILAGDTRIVFLYYNRNTYTLTLTKGTGIDSVTGAGTKEYGASVTIDATLTTNYTWSNWTNNNSNDAVVSATKNYTFTMPDSNRSYRANAVLGSRNCVAGYKDEQGQQPCDDGYYCPGGTVAASQSCQQPCPERPQGAKDLTTTGDRTAITQCQVTLTCVDAFNSNHELTGGGDKVCKYVDADRGYDNCIDVVVKYCLAGYYHDAVDTPFCTEVPVGSWSPDRAVANSCDNDPASKGMYSCDVLVNGVSATTAGKASGSPTACYTSCPTVPVTDGTGATIGTLRPDTETKNFSGTVTYSSTEPVTVVSVNGSYPACTYNNNEADCVNGYHANGTSCDPNIYKFILDKNGGTGGTDGPIYMKYNDGWYSNASATAASRITSITLPNKDEQNCSGYDMGAMTVINADGTITALPTIVNYADATTTTTLVAGWGDKQKTHCDPGYYYSAETDSCEECLPGSYCPGGDAFSGEDNDGDDLIFDCPTPAASNYTPAQSWSATTGLSNVLPQMSSDRGRTSISDCFATVRYDAIQGAGSQKCYYDATNETYDSSDCVANSITILTCNGGHHYNASETTIDCVPVGKGYYSIEYDPSRTRCPQAETYGDNITTNGTTSDSVGLCIHDNFWESKQNDANVNGAYIKRCFWNSDDSEYNINCGQSYRMRKCKAGYYDPHEGEATYAADARCIAVEDGNWSPGPANWNAVTEPDASIQINACPTTSAYAGTVANDIDSTKTNPATGTRTASAISQCYLNCITEKTSGSITYTVTNSPVYYNGTKYPLCEYESDEISCSTMTNGQYPKPASGATDINQCYRDCTAADVDSNARTWTGKVMYGNVNQCTVTKCEEGYYLENGACVVCPAGNYCDGEDKTKCPTSHPNSDTGNTSIDLCYKDCVATSPVATVSGRDYYGATDTCVATSCIDGYYLQNGACVVCPAGSYCDTDGKHQCPTGYTSATGSDQKTDCYQDCEPYDIGNCHLTPVGGDRAFWPNQCEYTATINGNPATIEDGVCVPTGCLPGYELIDGECEPCDRENALSYKEGDSCTVESCVIGFHPNGDQCEPDILECTPQAPHASYAEQKWNASRNAWGICTIKSCIEGYHLASNSCVADEQVCEIENGAGMKTWNPTTNSWGPCVATSCAPGYTNDPYLKNNASQQCSECRNKFSILGEAAADAWFDGDEDCIIASCIYQGEKYNLDNNECVPICDRPYSDETGSLMWNAFTHKCDRICNPGYVSW